MFILLEMVKQFPIKKDFAKDMLWHFAVIILYKINYLSQRTIIFDILEQMVDNLIECILRDIMSKYLLYLRFV